MPIEQLGETPLVEKFQVGWICAIFIEYEAACACLDGAYKGLPRNLQKGDHNTYQFGRIGHHDVVIACLPLGRYGAVSATSVASTMKRSFPIKFGLMVGIAGGAPSAKLDQRLGDIVVSMPTDDNGGVIAYDRGKAIQDQDFWLTGHLSQPSIALLSAANNVRLDLKQDKGLIERVTVQMFKDRPSLDEEHGRPDASTDVLYKSEYLHQGGKDIPCAEVCSASADDRVPRKRGTRPDSAPVVHYGLIASANTLMKDATFRDRLIEAKGIKCFEMEAAGLMDYVQCIVIRGICDYSDTHKNDDWQGWAAVVASAYGKLLLQELRSEVFEHTDIIGASRPDISAFHASNVITDGPTIPSRTSVGWPTEDLIAAQLLSTELSDGGDTTKVNQLPSSPNFSGLTNGRTYVDHMKKSKWCKMTTFSLEIYKSIVDSIKTRDCNGMLFFESFIKRIPDQPPGQNSWTSPSLSLHALAGQYWLLFGARNLQTQFPENYAMALLYMLHLRWACGYSWTRADFDGKDDDGTPRKSLLARFGRWVPCCCNEVSGCGLAWNFVNGEGLNKPVAENSDASKCLAHKSWDRSVVRALFNTGRSASFHTRNKDAWHDSANM